MVGLTVQKESDFGFFLFGGSILSDQIYKITKNLFPKNENEKYLIKDVKNIVINKSDSLKKLINKIIWKKFKLVN